MSNSSSQVFVNVFSFAGKENKMPSKPRVLFISELYTSELDLVYIWYWLLLLVTYLKQYGTLVLLTSFKPHITEKVLETVKQKHSALDKLSLQLKLEESHVFSPVKNVSGQIAAWISNRFGFKKRGKNKTYNLIAHGVGGRVAAHLLVVHKAVFNKAVFFETRFFRRKYLRERLLELLLTQTKLPFVKRFVDFLKPKNNLLFIKLWKEDVSELLPKVTLDTLLIWGDRDFQVPIVDGVEASKVLPKATLYIVNEGKHIMPFFPVMEELASMLDKFFTK